MDLSHLKFKEADFVGKDVASMPDRVVGRPAYIKNMFDNIAKNELALGRFNALIDALSGELKSPGNIECSLSSPPREPVAAGMEFTVAFDGASGVFKANLNKSEKKIAVPKGYAYAFATAEVGLKNASAAGEAGRLCLMGEKADGSSARLARSVQSLADNANIMSLSWTGGAAEYKKLYLTAEILKPSGSLNQTLKSAGLNIVFIA